MPQTVTKALNNDAGRDPKPFQKRSAFRKRSHQRAVQLPGKYERLLSVLLGTDLNILYRLLSIRAI
jgi:hypothetical protein